jgi:uncharacterized membrane protein
MLGNDMRSRTAVSFLLLAILIGQAAGVLFTAPLADAASARGGTNDNFYIVSVELGNASVHTDTWYNPDGTPVPYIFAGTTLPLTITVQRAGSSATPQSALVVVEAIHPIGYVDWSVNWTATDLYGGQQDSNQYLWTPSAAHSELINDSLEGGWIIRASINYFADTKNDDDVIDSRIPVAFDSDVMDGTELAANRLTFLPLGYQGGGDAEAAGSWQDDNGGVVGSKHWRHSDPGSQYASGRNADRLVRGYWPADPPQSGGCNQDIQEPGAPVVYSYYYCKRQLYTVEYVSLDFHLSTWGTMSIGDEVAIELWRTGGSSLVKNLTDYSPNQGNDQWSNISWRPSSAELGGQTWSYGLLFSSDSAFADEGLHIDDWIVFAVEKVDEYTLTTDCNNPETGYTAVPAETISLHCMVTNNGYKSQTFEVNTNVSNESWMDPMNPMLRIDSANQNQHGNSVLLPAIPAGETTEMWINLSVPPGADIQSVTWNVWFEEGTPQNTDIKGSISSSVVVSEQYGVMLSSFAPLLALDLLPSESGEIVMRLQNSGNLEAEYNLIPSFPSAGWAASFKNETGASFLPIILSKGESFDFVVNITSAADAAPGLTSVSIRASCTSCVGTVHGNDVLIRNINVPELRLVDVVADTLSVSAMANGVAQSINIDIYNLGNDDEQYTIELVQSDWHLGGELSTSETTVLDAWEGSTSITLNLPMPLMLPPRLYSARVNVVSIDDLSVYDSVIISVEVLPTSAPWVSDEDPEESYIPGDREKSIQFEIRNDGNEDDSFEISLVTPDGMSAYIDSLNDNTTIAIAPGASTNITVKFAFDEDISGQISMDVVSTSVNDPTQSGSGTAIFSVGSQNWLRLIEPSSVTISEPTEELELLFVLRNQYTGVQSVDISLDAGESSNYMTVRINQQDRTVVLETSAPGDERIIHVTVEVSEGTLINLDSEEVTVSFILWAKSNTVEDAQSSTMEITLQRISPTSGSEVDDGGGSSSVVLNVLTIGFGSLIIIALLVTLIRVLKPEYEEEDMDGYESASASMYGEVQAAPDMTSDFSSIGGSPMPLGPDTSMLGTSFAKDVPSVPPAQTQFSNDITPNIDDIVISEPPVVAPEPTPSAPAGPPPVPAEGLPPGWSMDQWEHYGEQWLSQQE